MIKLLIAIGLIVGPMTVTAARTTDNSPPTETSYTIQRGDSLYTIARKFGVSIEALRKVNHLGKTSLLHPGQKLRLPNTATSRTSTEPKKRTKKRVTEKSASGQDQKKERTYRVQAGDTLSGIALKEGITVESIRKANQMKSGALIRVGQLLRIPNASKSPEKKPEPKKLSAKSKNGKSLGKRSVSASRASKGIHIVRYGDTLFSIARQYHTPLKDLMSLNGIHPTDVIHPGQELKIPGSSYRTAQTKTEKRATGKKETTKSKSRPAKAAPSGTALVYTVKHGDTLWKIAQKHKVSISQIRRLNKMKHRDTIRTGMKLLIREGNPGPASGTRLAQKAKKKTVKKIEKHYTVKRGDTLWEIAKAHKISVAELRRLNGMKRGQVIHTGSKLIVGYEKVPPTRLAGKKAKEATKKASKKVAKKSLKKRKSTVASKTAGKKKRYTARKKSADRRINSALAALNGHGSRGGSGGGDYNVIRTAKKFLGRRYVWGAEGPSCFDCSGFTQYVMRKSKGVRIPRVSRKQAYYGKYVTRSQLRPGDLIFFDTSRRRRGYVNHVGIYIGNGKFIHASSARHRVVITSLNRPFYKARFKWGRRIN